MTNIKVALSVLSELMLCGCAANNGIPPLTVKVPDVCARVLRPVPLPQIAPTDDARSAFMRDDLALLTARSEIDAGRRCVTDMTTAYRRGRAK